MRLGNDRPEKSIGKSDLGGARLWRIDKEARYGVLNSVARNCLQAELITKNWDEFLRVAGSLKLGTVKASELIRGLQLLVAVAEGAIMAGPVGATLPTVDGTERPHAESKDWFQE